MDTFHSFYRGKRVLVTGHTGFKGAWLCEWLLHLGAQVTGYSLPAVEPSLFKQTNLQSRLTHVEGDVLDRAKFRRVLQESRPDILFHLAAQSLVRESYNDPVWTFQANTQGTVHLLDALRDWNQTCAVVCITTDKCYDNKEWVHGYREVDPLGGKDPYSASKAAAELAIASFRHSFFKNRPVRVASARAGNVIGGGDWANDRLVPDAVKALSSRQPILVRNPYSTRPWQHVLEPLSGYLWLAAKLFGEQDEKYQEAFNFGPRNDSNRRVQVLVEEILKHWPGSWKDGSSAHAPHEATLLHLSIDKAHQVLEWSPIWNFANTVEKTIHWYHQTAQKKGDAHPLTLDQIVNYEADARKLGMAWATKMA